MHFCIFYDIIISSGREKIPENKFKKEVMKMKKNMMKLLEAYVRKYNGMKSDLILDENLGCGIKYVKGKTYILSDVIYDMAALLDVNVSMDIDGFITIAE